MNRIEETMHAYILSSEDSKGGVLLNAKTPTGKIPLRLWKMENRASFPKPGDYILLETPDPKAAERELERWKSISLDSKWDKPLNCEHRIVPEPEIPEETRKIINRDRKPQIIAAKKLLEDPSPWKDAKLHSMLMQFAEDNIKKFFNTPAAIGKHHAWRGGLLVHTAEVASNCLSILESPMNRFYRDDLDSDALLLAAWFHDTGKMETYRMDGENPVIDAELEQKIGHPTISNLIFSDFTRRNGLGGDLSRLVSHCILSHHGKRAWGAVVRPRTTEAKILCRADYISSKMPD